MKPYRSALIACVLASAASGCSVQRWQPVKSGAGEDHSLHGAHAEAQTIASPIFSSAAGMEQQQGIPGIPASGADAAARLQSSPRKSQYVAIPYATGSKDSLMLWVSLPQGGAKAPVVIVIHDNQGLSTWARGVADQLAADGFIGIAPDLLSRVRGGASQIELSRDSVGKILGGVSRADRQLGVMAAAVYGMSLAGAEKKYGVVGFCWGGGEAFNHAVYSSRLGAAVVYYGTPPAKDSLGKIGAPVLGLYGGADARIGATVPGTDTAMKALGKSYQPNTFEGAGHGFLRSQDTPQNLEASRQAWPLTVAFLRKNLAVK